MAIRIRQTPYERTGANPGPYLVHPDLVRTQLGVIAMAGSPELPGEMGEEADADPDFTRITYDPGPEDTTTPAGRVRQTLKDFVDNAADIRIFGVGPDFVYSEGYTLADSAGAQLGNWVFYDTHNCDGDGRWVRGTDGEEVCTTSAGILYHEMNHVYLGHPSGTQDEDERAAVEKENDLRTAEGSVPRDPDHWPESDCGCPGGCCIVASVATGSPFSAEVHALRRVRDRALRRTTLGLRFFDALHAEYYRFSVPIARILAGSPVGREGVAAWLVRPLLRALELGQEYTRAPEDGARLGELLHRDQDGKTGLPFGVGWSDAGKLLERVVRGEALPSQLPALEDPLAGAIEILREHLPDCAHVRWGIAGPLLVYARAREWFEQGGSSAEIGWRMVGAFDEWAAALPLDVIKEQLTPDDWADDLTELSTTFFTSQAARRAFGTRLRNALPNPLHHRLEQALRGQGYLP